ncbi:MAG: ABC transporter substrate-binding protein [Gemmata sp.]
MGKRLAIVGGVLVAVLAVVVLAYFEPWKKADVKTRTVRLNTPFTAVDFAPYYVAKKKGWFEESLAGVGAKPDYLPPLQSIPASGEALATDRVDMLMTSGVPAIIWRSSGTDARIVWLSCNLESEVIVPVGSPATSIRDLKGKKVGLLSGSDSHYWFIKNLEANGMSRGDVEFVNLTPPDGKVAFKKGAIDAWAMFPPWPEQELVDGTAKVLPGLKAPIQVVMVARGAFCREHQDVAAGVLRAMDRGKKWVADNPAEAQSIVAEEINLPLPVVRAAWPKLVWSAELDGPIVADLQGKADFLKAEGVIRNPVNVRDDLLMAVPR